MNADKTALNAISHKIIGCAFTVSNTLGPGFLEKVYENALAHEIQKAGMCVAQQHATVIYYDDGVVGTYTADLLVENTVLVELKAIRTLDGIHRAQCMNYLKASNLRLCLRLNFGNPRLDVVRLINGD